MTTTDVLTLSDFLLARIGEDEAPTWDLIPYWCEPGCCAPAGWVGHRCLICGTEEFGGTVEAITRIAREHEESIHRRSRVLAECEAKRRIVAEHAPTESDPGDGRMLSGYCRMCVHPHGWPWNHYTENGGIRFPCTTLRLLAMPYADHPDYDETWRA